jgi:predicted phage-related endonuclease
MGVFLDKTGALPLERGNEAEYRRWGNLLEPAIMDEFEVRSGLYARHRGLMVEHKRERWMRATIDALVTETAEGLVPQGVLEVKTVAGFKSSAWAEGLPDHFALQVQHQLAVTGLEHAWVAVLFGGQRLEVLEVEREEETIESLVRLEGEFWHNHVVAGVAPSPDGSAGTTLALREAYAEVGAPPIELPVGAGILLAERASAKRNVRAASGVLAAIDQSLMALLGESEVGLIDGQPVVTWKRQERASVDLARLRAKHPELAARFTVRSGYRVLRLVGPENDEEEGES